MKNILIALTLLCSVSLLSQAQSIEIPKKAQTYHYAVDMNGVVCGYNEKTVQALEKDGKTYLAITDNAKILQTVLGGSADLRIETKILVDPETGQFVEMDSDIFQGTVEMGSLITIEGNTAYFQNKLTQEKKEVELPEDIILDNGINMNYLLRDLTAAGLEKDYVFFDAMRGDVETRTMTLIGKEEIEILGKPVPALKFSEVHKTSGLTGDTWIHPVTAQVLQRKFNTGRFIFLTDASVKKRIQVAKLDDVMFAKTNTVIPNIMNLSYLKVKAKIRSAGEWLEAPALSFPGQTFTGTVVDNLIEGEFVIDHVRYDGSAAPAFPTNYSLYDNLQKYLEPEDYIESNDPKIIAKAKKLTEGAGNAWEAANLITEFVARHVDYAIPGGITAINTLETAQGECGAHSRLTAALCRAVGIPTKFVVGCMYTNTYGGTFGQHAWNEVYMGAAGWIPVDATAGEIGFVDCGHIRLGEKSSFIPVEMEIIEYKHLDQEEKEAEAVPAPYNLLVGEYLGPVSSNTFKVVYQNGGIGVDIPDQMVVELFEPNEAGQWMAKVSNNLFFTFDYDEEGKAHSMHLNQLTPAPRRAAAEEIGEDVPENLRPYLGVYYFAPAMIELTVIYQNGGLAVKDPNVPDPIKLQAPDESGLWMDEFDQNGIRFVQNEAGEVTQLTIVSEFILPRK